MIAEIRRLIIYYYVAVTKGHKGLLQRKSLKRSAVVVHIMTCDCCSGHRVPQRYDIISTLQNQPSSFHYPEYVKSPDSQRIRAFLSVGVNISPQGSRHRMPACRWDILPLYTALYHHCLSLRHCRFSPCPRARLHADRSRQGL